MGEAADIHKFLDEEKIESEARYDGLYAVCTDLLEDDVNGILKVNEGLWQIEECFRIMKTDFSARPISSFAFLPCSLIGFWRRGLAAYTPAKRS